MAIDIDQSNQMVNLPTVKEDTDDNIFYDEEDDGGQSIDDRESDIALLTLDGEDADFDTNNK